LSESWECPKCQTLNAFGDHCYSCGTPRLDAPAQAVLPDASAWEPAAVLAPAPDATQAPSTGPTSNSATDEDTEPHPCWCNLVKGPHDTRDHPSSAAAGAETEDDVEADAHLDQLEADLGLLTHDWTDLTVKRTYDSGDDGEQEYEDEAMLFEEHGYSKLVERPDNTINATFTLGSGQP
jgi:hypothetical protein